IPPSTTQAARRSLSQSPQRRRLFPGFTTERQARRSVTPNQVRHPADCRFTSGCSPPRLAATQSPSITEPATGSGADLHRAVKASSRTHLPRRKPGPIVPRHEPIPARKVLRLLQEILSGGGVGPSFRWESEG